MVSGSWNVLNVTLTSPVSLFVRGGYIIVTQEPANNTRFRFHILAGDITFRTEKTVIRS